MAASADPRRRSPPATSGAAPGEPAARTEPVPRPPERASAPPLPFLLDLFPLESADQTRLARFFERLREGRLSTTRCRPRGHLHWPPRVACPECHSEELDWVDLPASGRIYAHSAVLAGAPVGLESDVPFAVGLVDLDGVPMRLFGRIVGRPWNELSIGLRVAPEPFGLPDGRVFYRFRTLE